MPVIVVLIQDHLQVLRPELLSSLDSERPQRELIQELERHGLEYLDLAGSFATVDEPSQLFFRKDKHWNERGHDFIAKLLLRHLSQSGGRGSM